MYRQYTFFFKQLIGSKAIVKSKANKWCVVAKIIFVVEVPLHVSKSASRDKESMEKRWPCRV